MNNRRREIFTIYTLGILDNGIANQNSNNSFLLINNWNNFLRDNIINMIPVRYNIQFIHCDIANTEGQRRRLGNNIEKITVLKSIIDDLICDNDKRLSNRVVSSNFIMTPLDFETIRISRNYLIIDMAGIFIRRNNTIKTLFKKYASKPYLTEVIVDNTVSNIDPTIIRRNIKYKNLNVVNLEYISNNLYSNYELAPSDIAKTRFFKILDDGSVITYEQRLIQIGYRIRPDYRINTIYTNICDKILRNKDISVVNNSEIKDELKKNKLQIIRLIMNNLMDDSIRTFNQLENKLIHDIETIYVPY